MLKRILELVPESLGLADKLLAQERMYEWHWEMHPMSWGWGIVMMAVMFLFWALVIIGLAIGIRWLLGRRSESHSDSAMGILRQRYARGEITKKSSRQRSAT